MASSFKKFWQGITLKAKATSTADTKGDLEVIDSTGKLGYHNGSTVSAVVTESHTATLTNKTIDADANTIVDLEVDNLKAGVLNTSVTLAGATDLQVPSALAVKTYVDSSSGTVQADVDDLITLSGRPANSTTLGTFTGNIITDNVTVKAALQELEAFAEVDSGLLSAHIADPTDAHDATAISVAAIVNLTATEAQGAFAEHQDDIDDLVALSGVAANAVNLGTFTGTTIPDNSTNKAALQALETASESDAAALAAHITDATDAHAGSAITNTPSGNLAATDVQAALNELQSDVDTRATTVALNAHINNVAGAHAATAISNTPAGTIAATTVQAAINELDGDNTTNASNLAAHLADTVDAHDASAISNVPAGNLAATDVQGALNELQTDVDTRATSAALTAHEADTTAIHGIADTSLLVTTTGTQTLSNKTFSDSVTIAEVATPATPASGFGKVYFKTDGKLYQLNDAGIETEVGSGAGGGGTPDVDVILTQTFDDAVLGDFTQTGLSLATTNPLNGTVSALLTHQAGTSQSFAQTVSVPRKFRGVSNTIYTTLRSTATSGNVTLTITDVTNSVVLQTSQLQTDSTSYSALTRTISSPTVSGFTNAEIGLLKVGMSVTGAGIPAATVINSISTTALTITLSQNATSTATGTAAMRISALPKTLQTGVTIPTNCLSISYTVTALLEANSPETYVDDIVIANFWMGSSNQGQSSLLVPTITTQSSYLSQATTTGIATVIGAATSTTGSGIYSYNAATGIYTMLVDANVSLTFSAAGITSTAQPTITINGMGFQTTAPVGAWDEVSWSGVVSTGQTFSFSNAAGSLQNKVISVLAQAVTTTSVVANDLVPAKAVLGNSTFDVPVVTAWASYTPTVTGFGTVTSMLGQWRQVGSSIEVEASWVNGTVAASLASITLPNGYSLDSNKITRANTTSNPGSIVGWYQNASASGASSIVTATATSTSLLYFGLSTTSAANQTPTLGTNIATSSSATAVRFAVPIAGLSANSAVTVSGTQQLLKSENDSLIRLDTYLGYGSTNTMIPRFTNIRQSIGSDILYQDSSTLGSSFTAQTSGTYSFSFSFGMTNATAVNQFGLSKNSTQLTTSISNIAVSDRLAIQYSSDAAVGEGLLAGSCSWTGYLAAGDVIRPHTAGSVPTVTSYATFTATKQGSTKVLNTTSDQKIEIPTSELRFEGSSSRGAIATAIVKFDTMAKIRGDAFTVTNTVADGTFVTMTKAGRINLSGTITAASQNGLYLTKNQTTLTSVPTAAAEILATTVTAGASLSGNIGYTGDVNVGDIIRFATTVTPAASTLNQFNISFQEQKISVSVSNTLPQFSESDSSVRVNTANGWGSTSTIVRRFANVVDNTGKDVVYSDSATLGASFVAQTSGIYTATYNDSFTVAGQMGITKNQTALTTNIGNLAASEILAIETTAGNDFEGSVSWTGYLVAGDIIRAVTNTGLTVATTSNVSFTMSKVGKPNVTGVNVTPFINVPQPDKQFVYYTGAVATLVNALEEIEFALTSFATTGSSLISIVDDAANTRTKFIALKESYVTATWSASVSGTNSYTYINLNGAAVLNGSAVRTAGDSSTVSWTGKLSVGDFLSFGASPSCSSTPKLSITAEATSDQILTANESFSTDTASLAYSSTYTLATLNTAPVGTFITFTYAASTNTRTQTTTAPTQTTSDMNVNGIQIFTRAYNAASTAAQPAVVAIQIGKGLKGKSLDLYKSSAKVNAGSLDSVVVSGSVEYGAISQDYTESTGVLLVDLGAVFNSTNTLHTLQFSDNTQQTSGYLVINASKSPALAGVPLLQPRIATISDVKATATAGGTATSGSYATRTLNTLSDPTGIVTSLASNQITLQKGTYYIEASAPANYVNSHKIKLQNITDATTALLGTVEYTSTSTAGAYQTSSVIKGEITISSAKVFEIQHRVQTTRATDGFGVNAGFDSEIYTIVHIQKIKD